MTKETPADETFVVAESAPARSLRLRVLSGSAIMLTSSVLVGGVNLIYNFTVAHQLGADKFGHASVVYTVLMLLSSITLSFQLVCSKYVARTESASEKASIYRTLHRRAWGTGLAIGGVLGFESARISEYLNLPSKSFILFLGIAAVFYVPLGVRRGFFQGAYAFRSLALNFLIEALTKLAGAIALMSSYGVNGVVAAMTASVIVAYFVAVSRRQALAAVHPAVLRAGFGEGVQAVTFFVGQVIINNLDIILVKHFFDATQAGVYAAVALVGRVVYMLSWSVVSSMFPFSAQARENEKGRTVLGTALSLVTGISACFIAGAWLAPAGFWNILLGPGFPAGRNNLYSSLLVLYAATTGLYAIAVVLMTYEISRKIGNVSWVQLGFSVGIVGGIYLFHGSLREVIGVQLVLMLALCLLVTIPFLQTGKLKEDRGELENTPARKLRQVDENEVIAQFLKSEFFHPEFSLYWDVFAGLVNNPDVTNSAENALRRALLFHRRGRLWRELPADTEWWEIELSADDIGRVRVFARNQWLRYGAPGFGLLETTDRIRERILSESRDSFIRKLRSLSIELAQNTSYDPVILIASGPAAPMTILEGNHRMAAAALISRNDVHQRFRFLCGFSPRMGECCWYRTDVFTLWRYARNTLAYYLFDRRKLTTEILQAQASNQSSDARAA